MKAQNKELKTRKQVIEYLQDQNILSFFDKVITQKFYKERCNILADYIMSREVSA